MHIKLVVRQLNLKWTYFTYCRTKSNSHDSVQWVELVTGYVAKYYIRVMRMEGVHINIIISLGRQWLGITRSLLLLVVIDFWYYVRKIFQLFHDGAWMWQVSHCPFEVSRPSCTAWHSPSMGTTIPNFTSSAERLAKMSLVWPDRGSNPDLPYTRPAALHHWATVAVSEVHGFFL